MIGYDDTYCMYMLYTYACTMCVKLPLLAPSPFCSEKERYSTKKYHNLFRYVSIRFMLCFGLDLFHSIYLHIVAIYRTSMFVLSLAFLPVVHLCSCCGQAFAVNEIGRSEWSEWSEELETHPFASGCFVDVSGGDGRFLEG